MENNGPAQITPSSEPLIGEGRPTIPLYLIKDREAIEEFLQEGAKMEGKMSEAAREEGTRDSIQKVWKDFKTNILTVAKKLAKKKTLKTNRAVDYWGKKRSTVLSQTGEIPKEETDVQLTEIKTQLARLNAIRIQRLCDHTAAKYFLEGKTGSNMELVLDILELADCSQTSEGA
jgi:hypothetical protein